VAGAVEVGFGIFLIANALPTVNGPERSVSRESEAAAKRTDTAEASMTRCWRQRVARERGSSEAHGHSRSVYDAVLAPDLLGMPMLGDFLEEGLSTLGYSCEEFEIERL
jgi:hypothetical protein